jgi:hypothetical protein
MDDHHIPSKNIIKNIRPIDYLSSISKNYENKIIFPYKLEKIDKNNISIPTIYNYINLTNYNYTIQQLRTFATYYKLKTGGTKKELITRIFVFLQLSYYVTKIQKIFRGKLQRKFNNLHGPAFKNRKMCTNSSDFITMDDLNDLSFNQFFSYKDVDGFIYGFDLASIFSLIYMKNNNNKKPTQNPYNRNNIPVEVLIDIKILIKIGKVLKKDIYLEIQDEPTNLSNEKVIELRALSLFQNINALGNYSNSEWFLSLSRNNLIKFVRELSDIWNYRAQLSLEVKTKICPPHGLPFRNLNVSYIHTEIDMNNVKKVILEVLEKLVNNGIDADSKSLGAYYVLAALTLVNIDAATSLPWLFQSVSHF